MTERAVTTERFVVGEEHDGERLDKALAALIPRVSRAVVQRWIGEDRVTVNGRARRAKDSVAVGDVIETQPGPPPPSAAIPDASVRVPLVYEDADLVVVDKPAGMVVHPGRGHHSGTLVNGLLALAGFGLPPSDPRDPDGSLRPGIVHRIDKDTSGLLVVAKTALAREGLKKQLADHSVERAYRALTQGVPTAGRIQTLHARHPRSRLKFTAAATRGRQAITHVAVVEVLAAGRAALVECRLETGRTHQIRVHLAETLARPLLADSVYGQPSGHPDLRLVEEALGRQALHAGVLGFLHPRSGERLRFEAPLPPDMQQALSSLRALS
ncbi:MAG TPA: RluA family pseudouridine synthase [Polyangiaceae bacterium]